MNYWIDKEPLQKFDPQWLINVQIAHEINQWLHIKGENALMYGNYLDRVMDLLDIVKIGVKNAEKIISENPERIIK